MENFIPWERDLSPSHFSLKLIRHKIDVKKKQLTKLYGSLLNGELLYQNG